MGGIAAGIYGGLGILCLARGLLRPNRAVVKSGKVARCSGSNGYATCDPADTIQAEPGTNCYAVASGRIVAVGETFVNLLVGNETVVLMYDGIVPGVHEGQYVGRGQKIATVDQGGTVRFSVTELIPSNAPMGYSAQMVPPSGWLAARGAKHAAKDLGDGTKWCEGGRNIQVPQDALQSCDFKRPEPGEFGLLPIEVDMG